MNLGSNENQIYEILLKLLHSIQKRDNQTYKTLVSENLTCFEPESHGNLLEGLEFHLFFGENLPQPEKYHLEVIYPVIRVYRDTAYASYSLLVQKKQGESVKVDSAKETRIFHKENDSWRMVHFHRSKA
ncbi:MAG: nuclear transport factor 2 family protein [Candidatus Hodarchaeales archaeon]|jgi:calcium/calmodulin-dependent protein kinase (CaM kinase) II